MSNSNIDVRKTLEAHMRDLAWSHWTELGVAGALRLHQNVAIDPEALILFGSALDTMDPRLLDEATDWCARFGSCISISRLKNLLRRGLGEERTFYAFTKRVNQASQLKWPSPKPSDSEKTETARSTLSGKSQSPDLARPALLTLRLRGVFGVGTRADVISELLVGSRNTANELAQLGYTKRQVAKILDDLTRAKVVERRSESTPYRYALRDTRSLQKWIGKSPDTIPLWSDCFRVLLEVHRLIGEYEHTSANLRALGMQRTFTTIIDSLTRLGWGVPVAFPPVSNLWDEMTQWVLDRASTAASDCP